MEQFNFTLYAASSPLFALIEACCVFAGAFLPWMLGPWLRRLKFPFINLLAITFALAGVAFFSWRPLGKAGFSGLLTRELLLIFTVTFFAGILFFKTRPTPLSGLHPITLWLFRNRMRGGVADGSTRREVIARLGKPKQRRTEDGRDIWHYEGGHTRDLDISYSVSFEGERVSSSWWTESRRATTVC